MQQELSSTQTHTSLDQSAAQTPEHARGAQRTTTVLLCGVGGQGTILAADLLAQVARRANMDVKLSEIHGMAQRGGAVTTTVRFGTSVNSMVTDVGSADIMVAFETTEALRNLHYVKDQGFMIVNDVAIEPLPVLINNAQMPPHARKRLKDQGAHIVAADLIAQQCGNPRTANVVLMGALSEFLPFDTELWKQVITDRVPEKTLDINLSAFEAGRKAAQKLSSK